VIVDLSDPTRAVTPTLDGPVLAVLASAGVPMTVGDVASRTPRGSEIGIRRALARLVEQGIVTATQMGRNRVHDLNRDHVAAQIAVLLAELRPEVWRRLRSLIGSWNPRPAYACVFGSAARGDGGIDSDIDILLVHAPFPGERNPAQDADRLVDKVAGFATTLVTTPLTSRQAQRWQRQVDDLRESVRAMTGNSAQIVEISSIEWSREKRVGTKLFEEIERDAIELFRPGPLLYTRPPTDR